MRTRSHDVYLFILYAAVLAFALWWIQRPFVREQVGSDLRLYYGLLVFSAVYLFCRAWLILMGRTGDLLQVITGAIDLALITVGVAITGGVRSECALLYLIPIFSAAIRRAPMRTIGNGVAAAVMYAAAVAPTIASATEVDWLITRLLLLALITSLATRSAMSEASGVAELVRLREQVALSDYRARLAREMHDGIQGYLVASISQLELANTLAATAPEQALALALEQRHKLRQVCAELRYVVTRVGSHAVAHMGFLEALRDYLFMRADACPFDATLEVDGEACGTLRPEVEQAVFRIVQEAFANSAKHARPTRFHVKLRFTTDGIQGDINDDGDGFDPASVGIEGQSRGNGLTNMNQRAEDVGGVLEIVSAPQSGTTVRFEIPAYARAEKVA